MNVRAASAANVVAVTDEGWRRPPAPAAVPAAAPDAGQAETFVRVVACGSVDDGKSTLIGRLLYEAGRVSEDERLALAQISARHGTRGGDIDYALLLDGLEAEREQGITIDVAWRHLETPQRRFLIADCPGHVQYTRNMATGASVADVAVVLVDATRGISAQTFRHTAIAALLGVRHVVLAVNKMDRVDDARGTFEAIAARYHAHAARLGLTDVQAIPLSAVDGDNVATRSTRWSWYAGASVLEHLAGIHVEAPARGLPVLPVQTVLRDADGGRWLAGTLGGGRLRVGDRLAIAGTATGARVAGLQVAGCVAVSALAGQAIALRLAEDVDAARGDVLAPTERGPATGDRLTVDVLWFDEVPLQPGRRYLVKLGTRTVGARVGELRHRLDPDTLAPAEAGHLGINDIGEVTLALDAPVAYVPYDRDRTLGGLLIIDMLSRATVGAGMVRRGGHGHEDLRWQALDVDRDARAALKRQRPRGVWLTGLSGSGKSTIANRVERELHARGIHTYLLDGDNLRHGLNRDLGFGMDDRLENQRRLAEVARLMTDAGLVTLVSAISPSRAGRAAARELFATGDFIEVFVDTPLAEAERRDVKGLYARARRGEITDFTGIDSPYESPEAPELRLDTVRENADALARRVIDRLLAD